MVPAMISLVFSVTVLAPLSALAGTTVNDPVTLDQITTPIVATSGSAMDISLSDKTITDTTASFNFSVKATKSATVILVMAYGSDPNKLIFDNSDPNATRTVIDSENIPTVGQVHNIQSPPTLTGLLPGTTYYFQIKDTANNIFYQKTSFTTTGTIPKPITLNLPTPTVQPTSADPNGFYVAVFNGTFTTNADKHVELALYYGLTPNSFVGPFYLFPDAFVTAGKQTIASYTLTQLNAGTTYYYKVRDTISNTDVMIGASPFSTPGTAPLPPQPYNPNAPGAGALLPNYTFPTNIGEPTGTTTTVDNSSEGTPLVPCGKNSDQSNPANKNCGFNHLIILVYNVIKFLMVLLIPLTALACIYTGVQMILHRQFPAELLKYKDRLLKIGVGLLVMLLAYTIVATVLRSLLGPDATKYLLINIIP